MKVNVWMLCLTGCLAVAATADAQQGRGRGMGGGFGRGGIFMLAGNDSVQKDLGLTSDEVAKVKTVTDDYGAAVREGMSGIQFGPNMSQEDRDKIASVTKENSEKFTPKLKAALTADQFTRLQQINWQNMRSAALLDPEVVKALTVTTDQQDKVKAINEEYGAKFQGLFTPGSPPDFAKMEEISKERDAKATEVLTKVQQDKFASLKGKEFDLAQLRGGRGGRGGGGGGGGGGGQPKRPQPKAE